MKRVIFYLSVFYLSISQSVVKAQADISLATHWNNRANYNPASISRPDYLYLFTNARQQWTGVAGTPKVLNVQASWFNANINSGFGISLVSDNIGVTQVLNPMFSYSYRIIDQSSNSYSLGLSAGAFSRNINGASYEPEVIFDPSLVYDIERYILPDANFGFEFQSTHIIFGLSSTHLFSIGNDSLFLNANHRYGYAIYKNNNSELFNYHVGIQAVNRSNLLVMELNTGIRLKNPNGYVSGPGEIMDLGLTYRSTKQMTVFFGLMLSPNFRIGYAFDHSFIMGFSANATHEIMLEYRIPTKEFNCKTCPNTDYWYR